MILVLILRPMNESHRANKTFFFCQVEMLRGKIILVKIFPLVPAFEGTPANSSLNCNSTFQFLRNKLQLGVSVQRFVAEKMHLFKHNESLQN